jgi:dolichyl-phosphate-mannose--protein O-mannosyl transferase
MVVAPLSFLLLLPLLDLATSHQLINPITHVSNMLASNNITFSAASIANYDPFGVKLSRPWEWILHNNRLDYVTVFKQGQFVAATYLFLISPTLWVLIIPAVIIMFIKSLKRNNAALFALCWFAVTYFFWVAITLIMDRTTYVYYFYPTIGAVCIGIALGWDWLLNLKGKAGLLLIALALAYLLICLYAMAITLPGSLWIKIPFSTVIFAYVFYYLSKRRDANRLNKLSA